MLARTKKRGENFPHVRRRPATYNVVVQLRDYSCAAEPSQGDEDGDSSARRAAISAICLLRELAQSKSGAAPTANIPAERAAISKRIVRGLPPVPVIAVATAANAPTLSVAKPPDIKIREVVLNVWNRTRWPVGVG